jgi:hypothetical protein
MDVQSEVEQIVEKSAASNFENVLTHSSKTEVRERRQSQQIRSSWSVHANFLRMSVTRTNKKPACFGKYFNTSKGEKPMYRFDQKAPENVAEPEGLRSWDHELHFTKLVVHGRTQKACLLQAASRSMILLCST